MVNTGLPSRDCQTCRRRRVKCDLRRPGCYRCEKIGKPCSGYRDLHSLTFRVQTPSSYDGHSKREKQDDRINAMTNTFPAVSDTKSNEKDYTYKDLNNFNPIFSSFQGASSPLSGLVESWDMHSIPLILTQFSFSTQGGIRRYGSLKCIPDLLQRVETESALYLACHAVSYSYLANKTRFPSHTLKHRSIYGKALRALRLAFLDPVLQKSDSTLLTIWMLGIYELIIGSPFSENSEESPVNWDIHSRALAAILHLRGSQQFESRIGCQLFQLAYHIIQIQSVQTGCPLPPEAPEWFDALQNSGFFAELVFAPLYRYSNEVIRICGCARSLINEGSPEKMYLAATKIVEACNDLESSMEDRFGDAMTLTSLSTIIQSTTTDDRGAIVNLHNRNYINACFLRLQDYILEMLSYISNLGNFSTSQHEVVARLQQISTLRSHSRADQILMTLPSFLPNLNEERSAKVQGAGPPVWADTLRLMWPVRVVAFSPVVKERHKLVAKAALSAVAYEKGVMHAVGVYYTTHLHL